MQKEAYTMKKVCRVGVSAMTFLSLSTVSPDIQNQSSTNSSAGDVYAHASVLVPGVAHEAFCVSSNLTEQSVGDIIVSSNEGFEEESLEFIPEYKKIKVNLRITDIQKHSAKFDFEEDYEEI